MFPFLLNITYQAMCNVIPIKNVRIQLPLNDKSIFCDWIKTVPAARVPDILGSKMGYRAIKTSESETNFYRRCLNSEPKPAAAPGSPHMEFCPPGFPVSGGRRGTSFEVDATFSDVWISFEIIRTSFCDTLLTLFDNILTFVHRVPLELAPLLQTRRQKLENLKWNVTQYDWSGENLFCVICVVLTMSGMFQKNSSSF